MINLSGVEEIEENEKRESLGQTVLAVGNDGRAVETTLPPGEWEIVETGAGDAVGMGLKAGVKDLAKFAGTATEYLGQRVGSETTAEIGREAREYWHTEEPADLQGRIVDEPGLLTNPAWWAFNLMRTGTSMLPGMVTGIGVGGMALRAGGALMKGRDAITIAGQTFPLTQKLVERLALAGGALAGGAVGGAQEGAGTYEELLGLGAPEQTAARGAEMMTLAAGLLNAISFNKMLKPEAMTGLKKFLTTGATESLTEWMEGPAEAAIKLGLLSREQYAVDDAIDQIVAELNVVPIAFVTGGAAGAGAGVYQKRQSRKYADAIKGVESAGLHTLMTDQSIKTLVDNAEKVGADLDAGYLDTAIEGLRDELAARESESGYLLDLNDGAELAKQGAAKEPWQMTRDEFAEGMPKLGLSERMSPADSRKYKLASIIDGKLYEAETGEVIHTQIDKRVIGGDVGKYPELYDNHEVIGGFVSPDGEFIAQSPTQYHKFLIKQALSEGRSVPESVLKDYPGLKGAPLENKNKYAISEPMTSPKGTANIPPETTPKAVGGKEPWEMTRGEYHGFSIDPSKLIPIDGGEWLKWKNGGHDAFAKDAKGDWIFNGKLSDLVGQASPVLGRNKKLGGLRVNIKFSKNSANIGSVLGDPGRKYVKEINIRGNSRAEIEIALDHEISHAGEIWQGIKHDAPYPHIGKVLAGGFSKGKLPDDYLLHEAEQAAIARDHINIVRKALSEGKDVPAEVLADYPDLLPNPTRPPEVGGQPVKNTITLFSGIDPTQTLKVLSGLRDNIKEAMPQLEALGQNVYAEGKTSLAEWSAGMKETLGETWESFKDYMRLIWEKLSRPLRNERGAVGLDINKANYTIGNPTKGIVFKEGYDREALENEPDWKDGKYGGDGAAAQRFAESHWSEQKTKALEKLVGGLKGVVFLAQPSTSRRNVQPQALAARLAKEAGGEFIDGTVLFAQLHTKESKALPPGERPFDERIYIPARGQNIAEIMGGRRVVVIDDIFTSGGSSLALIRALQREGIEVAAHAGYYGEARLIPGKGDIERLRAALATADITGVTADELAKVLTRQEIGLIIQRVIPGVIKEDAKKLSTSGREELARKLYGRAHGEALGTLTQDDEQRGLGGSADARTLGGGRTGQGVSPDADFQREDIDINALLDLAAKQDAAQGLPENPTYDQIRAEAARLAFEKIQKKIDLQERRQKAQAKKMALDQARQDPIEWAITQIIEIGGLSRDALAKDYDRHTITQLSRVRIGLVKKNGGWGIDDIAEHTLQGQFGSGDDLLTALVDYRGLKKSAAQYEGEWEEVFSQTERYDFYADLLEEEERIMSRLMGDNSPAPATGLKDVIMAQAGKMRMGDASITEYAALTAGLKKAEAASRKAFTAGKKDGARVEKRRAKQIAEMIKARIDARDEANKHRDALLKLSKLKNIPEAYREQIAGLLSQYDLLPRSPKSAERLEDLRAFLERQEARGESVDVPKALLGTLERYGRKHWREMTLDEMRVLHREAAMIAHLGKISAEMVARREKIEYSAVVKELLDSIGASWPTAVTAHDIETMLLDPSLKDRIMSGARQYLAELKKTEMLCRRLDGYEDQGPAWSSIYLPIKEASDREIVGFIKIIKELNDIFAPIKDRYVWLKEKTKIPGIPQILTKEDIMAVALNTGNGGNMDVLRHGMQWSDAQIAAITGRLTKQEWEIVNKIWALYESQYAALNEVHHALTGESLQRVDGHYHPIRFRHDLAWFLGRDERAAEMRDLLANMYAGTGAYLEHSFTIERKGGVPYPPDLSLDVVFKHLVQANHYVTHALAIRDVQRIIRDDRVRTAIETTPGGPELYTQLMPWLRDVAAANRERASAAENWIKTARRNTTIVALGMKVSVGLAQWLSIGSSITQVGAGNFMAAVMEFYGNPREMMDMIKAKSPEMAIRPISWDRELNDAYTRLEMQKFAKSQLVRDAFFGMIVAMDMMLAYPTWIGGYRAGLDKFNGDEQKAVEHADMSVRMAQGNALQKDLADIQRGGELKRLFTMFYTFFSAMHNQLAEIHGKYAKGKISALDLGMAWIWIVLFPVFIEHLLKEREMPSLEEFLAGTARFFLAGFPLIRDLASPIFGDFDYRFSPVTRVGEVIHGATKQWTGAVTGGDYDYDKLFNYTLEGSGYAMGLPTGQAMITIKGYNDIKNGYTQDLTRLLLRPPREGGGGEGIDDADLDEAVGE